MYPCRWIAVWMVSALVPTSSIAAPDSLPPRPEVDLLQDGRLRLWKQFNPARDQGSTEIHGGPGYRPPGWIASAEGVVPDGRTGLITRHEFSNYQLDLEYEVDESGTTGASVYLEGRYAVHLASPTDRPGTQFDHEAAAITLSQRQTPPGRHHLRIAWTHLKDSQPVLSTWWNGAPVASGFTFEEVSPGGFTPSPTTSKPRPGEENWDTGAGRFTSSGPLTRQLAMGEEDFTVWVRFRTRQARGGTLFAKCPTDGDWKPNAKALFVRGGRLVYDIGWVGAMQGGRRVDDGEWHEATLFKRRDIVTLVLDGEVEARRKNFFRPDPEAFVFKVGAANRNFGFDFDGLISEVRYFKGSPSKKQETSVGSTPDWTSAKADWAWSDPDLPHDLDRPELTFASLPGVAGPIRLQASGKGIRFLSARLRPLDTVDHAGQIQGWNAETRSRGQAIYEGLCVNCHGADGRTPALPQSRAFGQDTLKFGADPYSMFRTLTHGNGLMAAQTWMTPEERYAVIHYIQDQFVKPMNPLHRPFTSEYLAGLPLPIEGTLEPASGKERDFGPALASQFHTNAVSALTLDLGEGFAAAYDLHSLGLIAAWEGGFLNLDETQHMRLRGEGVPRPAGEPIPGLGTWFWGHDGSLDYPREGLLPRGPLPRRWLDYRGYYLQGDTVTFSYAIDGRAILERPVKTPGLAAMEHHLIIQPGPRALRLCLGQASLAEDNFKGTLPLEATELSWGSFDVGPLNQLLVAGEDRNGQPDPFMAAAVLGNTDGLQWSIDGRYRLVLHIPPGGPERRLTILRHAGRGGPALQSFAGLVRHRASATEIPDLTLVKKGGPSRWDEVLETQGTTGPEDRAYTLDTLTLPESNPWNSWFRTAALDFFPDGRMAVATHGGDIWIVSGIDRDLKALKWRRFAAGLYEPFGLRIVDGVVYATCKDRLMRLRDLNGDGEADFYESFSADTDVSFFFHAFNFDLQTDAAGNFYYSKAGQYTDHALPGAVIRVSPDGKSREVVCTGFRTPNGMGILPDGRLTVSDNQGNWMPASKVSLVREGGFYGYSQTHSSPPRWAPDGGRIDPKRVVVPETFDPPILWLPQDWDNSSGGQLWVEDERWGPLGGHLLHTSFGKGWMFALHLQEVGNVTQAAAVRLPLDFVTGIHRARVNPADGQVYAVGLNGWNGGGRAGLTEGGIQRVRYTGRPVNLITAAQATRDGLKFHFNFAAKEMKLKLRQWNYRWSPGYGSAHWSARNSGKEGPDPVTPSVARLQNGGTQFRVTIPGLKPVHQLEARLEGITQTGEPFSEVVLFTLNALPVGGPVSANPR